MQSTRQKVGISVLIPAKDEEQNIERCLAQVKDWADDIVVVDSQSKDRTVEIAEANGARVVQFHYKGGWPKKRNWAFKNVEFRHEWILLVDADEILNDANRAEIEDAIKSDDYDGYFLKYERVFLGRQLRHGDSVLWKLQLVRSGKGEYEKRLEDQDKSMSDMEIHEHMVVSGKVGCLKHGVRHEDLNSIDSFIKKHNAYSNWEAKVFLSGTETEIEPSPWGTQAQKRRWLKKRVLMIPGSPLIRFLYLYFFRLGFLDGMPGLIYYSFKWVQFFHIKAKIYERKLRQRQSE